MKSSGNQLQKMMRLMEMFRLMDAIMPIQTASAFLFIANNEELKKRTTMSDIAKYLDFQPSAVTRNVSNLSDWNYKKEKGLGLVQIDYDPYDQRTKLVTLSGKGKNLINKLKETLYGN